MERWWRDERKAFQIASALGGGTRLSLEVLRELRLILRLMRFKRMQAEYCGDYSQRCAVQPTAVALNERPDVNARGAAALRAAEVIGGRLQRVDQA